MRRTLSFLVACFLCIGAADAAVRSTKSSASRSVTTTSHNITSRSDTPSNQSRNVNSSRTVTTRPTTVTKRDTVSRSATPTQTSRTTTQRQNKTASRSTTANTQTVRTATKTSTVSRAATTTKTFGVGYNSCRDAYFTCMDQFCATADDAYRRCMCSSRLSEIKSKKLALNTAADQIQNFKDLNIEVIPKTAAQVNAMLNASEGEFAASIAKDTSDSAQKLAGIGAVLSGTKSKSLSTAGTLDIAGDINAIWATTDLASGVNIANLTGEALYNAVHSQCSNLVADHCESKSTLNMVIAAYGMYIENDCTLLSNALGKQKTSADATIRETEREMNQARLDNYNAHNSTSINDCVAKVRSDLTRDNACGNNYIHCLDVSGLYLNKTTGEPIYTADFYQLETMLSLSGDILTNQTNRLLVAELNRKRSFAEKSLSTCQDLADEVWDEFVRQAVTEIYQGQQARIRQVKDECLEVVNKCYDKQTASLRDFSNTKEQLTLGSQLELSEQLCKEKLDACSNLYGGGTDGMRELVTTMYNITSQKIAQNCLASLKEYATNICAVPPSDTLHAYPYACRVYAPGEQKYAMNWNCQGRSKDKTKNTTNGDGSSDTDKGIPTSPRGKYECNFVKFTSCARGFYLSDCANNKWGKILKYTDIDQNNQCIRIQDSKYSDFPGGRQCPLNSNGEYTEKAFVAEYNCDDYVGSLYQKIVNYAIQACMRPSETETPKDNTPISPSVLQDVNATMDSIKISMSKTLQTECERLGGYWMATPYDSDTNDTLYSRFYEETGANTKWGYCKQIITDETNDTSTNSGL